MDKQKRNILIVVGVILLIIVVACFIYIKNTSKEDDVKITYTNSAENEVSTNEVENVIEENIVENEVIENNTTNKITENQTVPSSSVYETNTDLGTTNKKQEAIGLVQKEWGEDDSVQFRCDSVTSDGKYIIAVISKKTATVQNYFEVDLAKKTVKVDY